MMTSLQERLFALQDKQYAAFQAKLTPGVPMDSFIGIRVPALRKFAKEYAAAEEEDSKMFLQQLPHTYYDENILHSLLISQIKDYDECIQQTEKPSSHTLTTGRYATSYRPRFSPSIRMS